MTDTDEQPAVATHGSHEPRRQATVLARVRAWSRSGTVEVVAFWLAVGLPLVYLPVLATGLDGGVAWLQFVALLALHACCLVVGHSYRA